MWNRFNWLRNGDLLTLFHLGGGLFDPLYHESVCCIYRTRTRFTKLHDFVPFGICQDPAKLFPTFFSKKFEIFDVEIFWGSLSIRKKWKKFQKFFFWKIKCAHFLFDQNVRNTWFNYKKVLRIEKFPVENSQINIKNRAPAAVSQLSDGSFSNPIPIFQSSDQGNFA